MVQRQSHRLFGLQMLRFFAAFSVLVGHTLHEAASFGLGGGALANYNFGIGVDVFFVISGFIMFHISADDFGEPGAQLRFLRRRFVRLVPLYWLFTIAMLAATALLSSRIASSHLDVAQVIASFAFIPWLNDGGLAHPVLGLGWTLNYEMFFYVIFSFALLLPARMGLTALAVVFIALVAANPLIDPGLVQIKVWSDPIILEFLFGIGIAATLRHVALPRSLSMALIVLGTAGLTAGALASETGPFARVLFSGIPAGLLVAGVASAPISARNPIGRGLVFGGDASYALYLSHPFSINVFILLWQKLGLGAHWAFVPAAVIFAIFAASLVHVLVERPLTAGLNRRPDAASRRVAVAPAE